MSVSVPTEKVYYYRSRPIHDVVLCWLPRSELDLMVASGRATASITRDYPRGLDVRLCESELRYLRTVYSLDLGPPLEALLLAFEAIQKSSALPGRGMVRGRYLDKYAARFVREEGIPGKALLSTPGRARRYLSRAPVAQSYFDRELRAMVGQPAPSGGTVGKKKALEKLVKVKEPAGEHPFQAASRLQRRQARGRR